LKRLPKKVLPVRFVGAVRKPRATQDAPRRWLEYCLIRDHDASAIHDGWDRPIAVMRFG
jgi:hypothetical protein